MHRSALISLFLLSACVDLPYGGKCGEIRFGTPVSSLTELNEGRSCRPDVGSVVKGADCGCRDSTRSCRYHYVKSHTGGRCGRNGSILDCGVIRDADAGVVTGVFAHCESYD